MSQPFDIPTLIDAIKTTPLHVAVFGEFSSGKTTFLNALLGEELLSVSLEPTTAVPTFIRYGRAFNLFVYKKNGERLAFVDCRSANRKWYWPCFRSSDLGFRLSRRQVGP